MNEKNTPPSNDLEIAQRLCETFAFPADFHDCHQHAAPTSAPLNELTLEQAYRLILEDRMLHAATALKGRAFEISRSRTGNKLVRANHAGEMFYGALNLPSVPLRPAKYAFTKSHDVLTEAALRQQLSPVFFTKDPLQVVGIDGILEGELISAFLADAAKQSTRKAYRDHSDQLKKLISENLRNARELFENCANLSSAPEVIKVNLYHPTDMPCHTLTDTHRVLESFFSCLLEHPSRRVVGIAAKRRYSPSDGYFYTAWVLGTDATNTYPCHLQYVTFDVWQSSAGSKAISKKCADFDGMVAVAERDVQIDLMADAFLHLEPDAKFPHFLTKSSVPCVQKTLPKRPFTGHACTVPGLFC